MEVKFKVGDVVILRGQEAVFMTVADHRQPTGDVDVLWFDKNNNLNNATFPEDAVQKIVASSGARK